MTRPARRSPRTAPSAWLRVYAVVRRIPRGRVSTYGAVALAAGFGRAARVAGWALHALPRGSDVPWHRVVAAGGRLSLARLDLDAALTQRLRLEKEGVRFDARGRVPLASYAAKLGAARRTSARRRG
jgi:methylated-DNA-protein-cysteine methyltransferase-like protein